MLFAVLAVNNGTQP